jgi:hypothetical protein
MTLESLQADTTKYVHCTRGAVLESRMAGVVSADLDVLSDREWLQELSSDGADGMACKRVAAVTVTGQPLMRVVLSIQAPPRAPRTKRTRLVLPPVLSGHVSSFPPY